MPDDAKTPTGTTENIDGIPLYLIPKTIADQIRKKGDTIFQIRIVRTFCHHYIVIVETLDEHARRTRMDKPAGNEGDVHG